MKRIPYIKSLSINKIMIMRQEDFKYVVIDMYQETLKAFRTKEEAKEFIRHRPDCHIEEIPGLDYDDLIDMYGEAPF